MLFDRPIAAFDIETIPDPDVGRRVLRLEGDDEAVVHQMVAARLEETEGRTGYPQLPYHRVVTIGTAWLDPSSGRFELGVLGGEGGGARGLAAVVTAG
jgi:predicted PolB exonuclease-like 3'-5' exonuclease